MKSGVVVGIREAGNGCYIGENVVWSITDATSAVTGAQVRFDAGSFVGLTSGGGGLYSHPGTLGLGLHTYEVHGFDALGNFGVRLGSFTVSPVGTVPLTVEQTAPVTTAGQLDLLCHTGAFATVDVTIAGSVHTLLANVSGDAVFNNLPIALGVLSVTVEAYVIPSVKTTVNHKVRYAGSARVWDLDDYYRATGHIQNLPTSKLGDALNDFGTLTSNDGDGLEVYGYDDANNIALVSTDGALHVGSSSVMNELESLGSLRTNIQYDQRGNLVSFTEGGLLHVHTWNLRDQLIKVEKGVDVPGLKKVAEYGYYPDGMRSEKKVYDATGTTITLHEHYYGVGMSVHEVYAVTAGVESAQPTKEFVYEGLDRPVAMFTNADGNGGTGFQGREPYFFHANPRGDVYALTNESGAIVERYTYSLHGITSVMNASYQLIDANGQPVGTAEDSKSAFGNPMQFGGAYKDDETCMMNMRHRYYDHHTGGFLSRDPVEDDSLGNLYAGFERNAGTRIDPMGLMSANEGGSVTNSLEEFAANINSDSDKGRYIYTDKCGWIDRAHLVDVSKNIVKNYNRIVEEWNNDDMFHTSSVEVTIGMAESAITRSVSIMKSGDFSKKALFSEIALFVMQTSAQYEMLQHFGKGAVEVVRALGGRARDDISSSGNFTNFSFEDMPSNWLGVRVAQYMVKDGLSQEMAILKMLNDDCICKSERSHLKSKELFDKMKKSGFFDNAPRNFNTMPYRFNQNGKIDKKIYDTDVFFGSRIGVNVTSIPFFGSWSND